MAQTLKQSVEGELVTKADSDVTMQGLRTEMRALRAEIRSLRADIRRRLWVVAAVVVAANVTLIKLLP